MAHCLDDNIHHACCEITSPICCQTLDELDFQKGIWGAALDGDVERIESLLLKGVSPDATDSAGYKPLHYAARNGHYMACETLLQFGADVNATTRSIGATPLHRAVTQGHTKVIDLLLEHGADANLRDADGKTPLHRAITNVDVSIDVDACKLLVPFTDLTIKDNSGRTVEECFQQIADDHAAKVKKMHFDEIEVMMNKQLWKKAKEEEQKNALKAFEAISELRKKKQG